MVLRVDPRRGRARRGERRKAHAAKHLRGHGRRNAERHEDGRGRCAHVVRPGSLALPRRGRGDGHEPRFLRCRRNPRALRHRQDRLQPEGRDPDPGSQSPVGKLGSLPRRALPVHGHQDASRCLERGREPHGARARQAHLPARRALALRLARQHLRHEARHGRGVRRDVLEPVDRKRQHVPDLPRARLPLPSAHREHRARFPGGWAHRARRCPFLPASVHRHARHSCGALPGREHRSPRGGGALLRDTALDRPRLRRCRTRMGPTRCVRRHQHAGHEGRRIPLPAGAPPGDGRRHRRRMGSGKGGVVPEFRELVEVGASL